MTLSCRSGLSPAPDTRFSWYLNGALRQEGSSSIFLLPAASRTDAGSYYCRTQAGPNTSGPSLPTVLTVFCELALATGHCSLCGIIPWEPPATPFHILLTLGLPQRVVIGLVTMDLPT